MECGVATHVITVSTWVGTFEAPMLGMYTISTCGSNFDTTSKIEGPGIENDTWRDDTGGCRSNSRNEVWLQHLVVGNYTMTVGKYGHGSWDATTTYILAAMIICPDVAGTFTPAPTTVGQIPPIRCGETRTVNFGAARWEPLMLDLSSSSSNKRVYLNTCASTTINPELCLNAEYIDDDQIETGGDNGDCSSRQYWSSAVGLAETVTYVLSPQAYHIQVGNHDGNSAVTLTVSCFPSADPATVLRNNQSYCYGNDTDLDPFTTTAPTMVNETYAPVTAEPTRAPRTPSPTHSPASSEPTSVPTQVPSRSPVSSAPTTTNSPTSTPTTGPTRVRCVNQLNNCLVCTNVTHCRVCMNSRYLFGGTCVETCPGGYTPYMPGVNAGINQSCVPTTLAPAHSPSDAPTRPTHSPSDAPTRPAHSPSDAPTHARTSTVNRSFTNSSSSHPTDSPSYLGSVLGIGAAVLGVTALAVGVGYKEAY